MRAAVAVPFARVPLVGLAITLLFAALAGALVTEIKVEQVEKLPLVAFT